MPASPDAVADLALDVFDRLPNKCKPRPRSDGSREWIPLSGIVISKDGALTCVSLGTGMKCLPTNKLPQASGNVLHDWHAEMLAIRGFNSFLIEECLSILNNPHVHSQFVVLRDTSSVSDDSEFQPFRIRDDVEIHMYCSEAPCGDASMELVMDAQEDATPWTSPPPIVSLPETDTINPSQEVDSAALRGRSHFGLLGAVRLKPSRPDAPPTLSKSCTDKLTLTQCASLLSSLTSLLISPENAFLSSLILPQSQYVESACLRAFSRRGRMSVISPEMEKRWLGGYAFKPFTVRPTSREFKYSRRNVLPSEKPLPCNLSAVYTPHVQETLVSGVLQGRKQSDPRGASRLSRRLIWKAVAETAEKVEMPVLVEATKNQAYSGLKNNERLATRRKVKQDVREALKGWVRNSGDDEFGINSENAA